MSKQLSVLYDMHGIYASFISEKNRGVTVIIRYN